MKKISFIMLLIGSTALANPEAKHSFSCTSQDVSINRDAKLTFLQDGSGQVSWNERSVAWVGEPNASEDVGDIYDLTDSLTGEEGFQLIISHELADERDSGTVELWGEGSSQGVYDCK